MKKVTFSFHSFFFSPFSLFLLTIFLFFFFTQEPKKNVQPQPGPGADYDMLMKMLLIGDNGLTQISFFFSFFISRLREIFEVSLVLLIDCFEKGVRKSCLLLRVADD